MPPLAACAGTWVGTNGFRLMPADSLAVGPASLTVTLAAGEFLTSLVYRWEHPQDGPQDGLVVFGAGDDVDALVGLWGDSWHQQPQPMAMTGRVAERSVELDGEYGGGRGWRIVIDAEPTDLRLRMENVIPADQATVQVPAGPYDVMLMELRRS